MDAVLYADDDEDDDADFRFTGMVKSSIIGIMYTLCPILTHEP